MQIPYRQRLERRLRDVDYRMVMDMRCPTMDASAHATREDARRGINPIVRMEDAHRALFYRVVFRIRTLIGRDQYSDPASQPVVALFDLNAGGNYPYSRPEVEVLGNTVPWSPHFGRGIPVCYERPGEVWTPDGKTALAHLILQVLRLANFDEALTAPDYGGYNRDAVKYWRATLHSRPINPELVYPSLPAWFLDPDTSTCSQGNSCPAEGAGQSPGAQSRPKARVTVLMTHPASGTPRPKARVVGW